MEHFYKLNNGVLIPSVGFGTWQTPDGQTAINAVKFAIECGYRHIDCAAVYGNETLGGIAAKYGKSVAQLCIRWALQHDVLPLPKSITPERIEENLNVWDFPISDSDMAVIDAMAYCGGSGLDPDKVDF